MQYAGPANSQGTSGTTLPMHFGHGEVTSNQTVQPTANAASTTSILRNYRKKDSGGGGGSGSEKVQNPEAAAAGEVQGPVARVAPHAHYPKPSGGDGFRYHHQHYADFGMQQAQVVAPPVKYSEIIEPVQTLDHHLTRGAVPKTKEKGYFEMACGQAYAKTGYEYNFGPRALNNTYKQQFPTNPGGPHHLYHHQHHGYFANGDKNHQQQYLQKDAGASGPNGGVSGPNPSGYGMNYNKAHQYQGRYGMGTREGNDFLSNLNKIAPDIAQDILNDQHLREQQFPPVYLPDQNRLYAQQQHARTYQRASAVHANAAFGQRNLGYNQYHHQLNQRNFQDNYRFYQNATNLRLQQFEQQVQSDALPRYESQHHPFQNRLGPTFDHCATQLDYQQPYAPRNLHFRQDFPPPVHPKNFFESNPNIPEIVPEDIVSGRGGAAPGKSLKSYLESWNEEAFPDDDADAAPPKEGTLYVLETMEIPSENVPQYIHLQPIEKLPPNVRTLYPENENGANSACKLLQNIAINSQLRQDLGERPAGGERHPAIPRSLPVLLREGDCDDDGGHDRNRTADDHAIFPREQPNCEADDAGIDASREKECSENCRLNEKTETAPGNQSGPKLESLTETFESVNSNEPQMDGRQKQEGHPDDRYKNNSEESLTKRCPSATDELLSENECVPKRQAKMSDTKMFEKANCLFVENSALLNERCTATDPPDSGISMENDSEQNEMETLNKNNDTNDPESNNSPHGGNAKIAETAVDTFAVDARQPQTDPEEQVPTGKDKTRSTLAENDNAKHETETRVRFPPKREPDPSSYVEGFEHDPKKPYKHFRITDPIRKNQSHPSNSLSNKVLEITSKYFEETALDSSPMLCLGDDFRHHACHRDDKTGHFSLEHSDSNRGKRGKLTSDDPGPDHLSQTSHYAEEQHHRPEDNTILPRSNLELGVNKDGEIEETILKEDYSATTGHDAARIEMLLERAGSDSESNRETDCSLDYFDTERNRTENDYDDDDSSSISNDQSYHRFPNKTTVPENFSADRETNGIEKMWHKDGGSSISDEESNDHSSKQETIAAITKADEKEYNPNNDFHKHVEENAKKTDREEYRFSRLPELGNEVRGKHERTEIQSAREEGMFHEMKNIVSEEGPENSNIKRNPKNSPSNSDDSRELVPDVDLDNQIIRINVREMFREEFKTNSGKKRKKISRSFQNEVYESCLHSTENKILIRKTGNASKKDEEKIQNKSRKAVQANENPSATLEQNRDIEIRGKNTFENKSPSVKIKQDDIIIPIPKLNETSITNEKQNNEMETEGTIWSDSDEESKRNINRNLLPVIAPRPLTAEVGINTENLEEKGQTDNPHTAAEPKQIQPNPIHVDNSTNTDINDRDNETRKSPLKNILQQFETTPGGKSVSETKDEGYEDVGNEIVSTEENTEITYGAGEAKIKENFCESKSPPLRIVPCLTKEHENHITIADKTPPLYSSVPTKASTSKPFVECTGNIEVDNQDFYGDELAVVTKEEDIKSNPEEQLQSNGAASIILLKKNLASRDTDEVEIRDRIVVRNDELTKIAYDSAKTESTECIEEEEKITPSVHINEGEVIHHHLHGRESLKTVVHHPTEEEENNKVIPDVKISFNSVISMETQAKNWFIESTDEIRVTKNSITNEENCGGTLDDEILSPYSTLSSVLPQTENILNDDTDMLKIELIAHEESDEIVTDKNISSSNPALIGSQKRNLLCTESTDEVDFYRNDLSEVVIEEAEDKQLPSDGPPSTSPQQKSRAADSIAVVVSKQIAPINEPTKTVVNIKQMEEYTGIGIEDFSFDALLDSQNSEADIKNDKEITQNTDVKYEKRKEDTVIENTGGITETRRKKQRIAKNKLTKIICQLTKRGNDKVGLSVNEFMERGDEMRMMKEVAKDEETLRESFTSTAGNREQNNNYEGTEGITFGREGGEEVALLENEKTCTSVEVTDLFYGEETNSLSKEIQTLKLKSNQMMRKNGDESRDGTVTKIERRGEDLQTVHNLGIFSQEISSTTLQEVIPRGASSVNQRETPQPQGENDVGNLHQCTGTVVGDDLQIASEEVIKDLKTTEIRKNEFGHPEEDRDNSEVIELIEEVITSEEVTREIPSAEINIFGEVTSTKSAKDEEGDGNEVTIKGESIYIVNGTGSKTINSDSTDAEDMTDEERMCAEGETEQPIDESVILQISKELIQINVTMNDMGEKVISITPLTNVKIVTGEESCLDVDVEENLGNHGIEEGSDVFLEREVPADGTATSELFTGYDEIGWEKERIKVESNEATPRDKEILVEEERGKQESAEQICDNRDNFPNELKSRDYENPPELVPENRDAVRASEATVFKGPKDLDTEHDETMPVLEPMVAQTDAEEDDVGTLDRGDPADVKDIPKIKEFEPTIKKASKIKRWVYGNEVEIISKNCSTRRPIFRNGDREVQVKTAKKRLGTNVERTSTTDSDAVLTQTAKETKKATGKEPTRTTGAFTKRGRMSNYKIPKKKSGLKNEDDPSKPRKKFRRIRPFDNRDRQKRGKVEDKGIVGDDHPKVGDKEKSTEGGEMRSESNEENAARRDKTSRSRNGPIGNYKGNGRRQGERSDNKEDGIGNKDSRVESKESRETTVEDKEELNEVAHIGSNGEEVIRNKDEKFDNVEEIQNKDERTKSKEEDGKSSKKRVQFSLETVEACEGGTPKRSDDQRGAGRLIKSCLKAVDPSRKQYLDPSKRSFSSRIPVKEPVVVEDRKRRLSLEEYNIRKRRHVGSGNIEEMQCRGHSNGERLDGMDFESAKMQEEIEEEVLRNLSSPSGEEIAPETEGVRRERASPILHFNLGNFESDSDGDDDADEWPSRELEKSVTNRSFVDKSVVEEKINSLEEFLPKIAKASSRRNTTEEISQKIDDLFAERPIYEQRNYDHFLISRFLNGDNLTSDELTKLREIVLRRRRNESKTVNIDFNDFDLKPSEQSRVEKATTESTFVYDERRKPELEVTRRTKAELKRFEDVPDSVKAYANRATGQAISNEETGDHLRKSPQCDINVSLYDENEMREIVKDRSFVLYEEKKAVSTVRNASNEDGCKTSMNGMYAQDQGKAVNDCDIFEKSDVQCPLGKISSIPIEMCEARRQEDKTESSLESHRDVRVTEASNKCTDQYKDKDGGRYLIEKTDTDDQDRKVLGVGQGRHAPEANMQKTADSDNTGERYDSEENSRFMSKEIKLLNKMDVIPPDWKSWSGPAQNNNSEGRKVLDEIRHFQLPKWKSAEVYDKSSCEENKSVQSDNEEKRGNSTVCEDLCAERRRKRACINDEEVERINTSISTDKPFENKSPKVNRQITQEIVGSLSKRDTVFCDSKVINEHQSLNNSNNLDDYRARNEMGNFQEKVPKIYKGKCTETFDEKSCASSQENESFPNESYKEFDEPCNFQENSSETSNRITSTTHKIERIKSFGERSTNFGGKAGESKSNTNVFSRTNETIFDEQNKNYEENTPVQGENRESNKSCQAKGKRRKISCTNDKEAGEKNTQNANPTKRAENESDKKYRRQAQTCESVQVVRISSDETVKSTTERIIKKTVRNHQDLAVLNKCERQNNPKGYKNPIEKESGICDLKECMQSSDEQCHTFEETKLARSHSLPGAKGDKIESAMINMENKGMKITNDYVPDLPTPSRTSTDDETGINKHSVERPSGFSSKPVLEKGLEILTEPQPAREQSTSVVGSTSLDVATGSKQGEERETTRQPKKCEREKLVKMNALIQIYKRALENPNAGDKVGQIEALIDKVTGGNLGQIRKAIEPVASTRGTARAGPEASRAVPATSRADNVYEVSTNRDQMKLHLKKVAGGRRKRRRFRNLYADDSEDEGGGGGEWQQRFDGYSIVRERSGEAAAPKLVIKLKKNDCRERGHPYVQLSRLQVLEEMVKKRKRTVLLA